MDLRFWCALLLCFRCVLRVGHVTQSPHVLHVRDIIWTSDGMDVIVSSSKTLQYKERCDVIPVVAAPSSPLCPVRFLKHYLRVTRRHPCDTLFGLTYSAYSTQLKSLCEKINLQGHYSTHSVRRGAASFLAQFMPLHDVKMYGGWRSWAVLLYLSDMYDSRKVKDYVVAEKLNGFV